MSPFARTLLWGFGLLGIFILCTLFSGLLLLDRQAIRTGLRDFVLSAEDRHFLAERRRLGDEAPLAVPGRDQSAEMRMLEILSEKVVVGQANQVNETLKARSAAIDEREAFIAGRERELREAEADLARRQRQATEQLHRVDEALVRLDERQQKWAADLRRTTELVQVLDQAEQTRRKELAVVYEKTEHPWWQGLAVPEIARILMFMDQRKAAKVLDRMARDDRMPGLPQQLHKAILAIDLAEAGQAQVERLALLYAYMPVNEALGFLADSPATEIAAILTAMKDQPKKAAALLDGLARTRAQVHGEVQRLLDAKAKEAVK